MDTQGEQAAQAEEKGREGGSARLESKDSSTSSAPAVRLRPVHHPLQATADDALFKRITDKFSLNEEQRAALWCITCTLRATVDELADRQHLLMYIGGEA